MACLLARSASGAKRTRGFFWTVSDAADAVLKSTARPTAPKPARSKSKRAASPRHRRPCRRDRKRHVSVEFGAVSKPYTELAEISVNRRTAAAQEAHQQPYQQERKNQRQNEINHDGAAHDAMTDASASAVSFHILTHVISSRHEKRLHLSRASIVKYVPAEVRPRISPTLRQPGSALRRASFPAFLPRACTR